LTDIASKIFEIQNVVVIGFGTVFLLLLAEFKIKYIVASGDCL
jgi:hypothetical protein